MKTHAVLAEQLLTLQIIGSGFGRTGTTSLKEALEILGFGPCHQGAEVIARPEQIAVWHRALAGEAVDWSALLDRYRAQLDWPGAYFWQELSQAFPEARIVHSVRSTESWWNSYSATIGKLLCDRHEIPLPPHLKPWFDDLADMVGRRTFGSDVLDKDAAIAAFSRHTEDVRAAIPPSRLLVFDVADGWEPLCNFLGVAVPDLPFPQLNNTAEFWTNITAADPANRKLFRRLVNRLALRRLARPHFGI